MGNRRNRNKETSAPTDTVDSSVGSEVKTTVDETQAVENPETTTPEVTEETPETVDETSEEVEEAPEVTEEDEPTEDKGEKNFWVDGYGNVTAKSQAAAEKKAKKIVEDRRK